MTRDARNALLTTLVFTCLFAIGTGGCVEPFTTTEPSGTDDSDIDLTLPREEMETAVLAGCNEYSIGPIYVECLYDAPELQYSDGWTCTPPGDLVHGRCSAQATGKSVTAALRLPSSPLPLSIGVFWRVSSAHGSAYVIIDGVSHGEIFQGEGSPGFKTYPVGPGLHTIKLIKTSRHPNRRISVHSFVAGYL